MNGDMSEVLAALNKVSDPFIATKCSALIKVLLLLCKRPNPREFEFFLYIIKNTR